MTKEFLAKIISLILLLLGIVSLQYRLLSNETIIVLFIAPVFFVMFADLLSMKKKIK